MMSRLKEPCKSFGQRELNVETKCYGWQILKTKILQRVLFGKCDNHDPKIHFGISTPSH